MMGVGRAEGGDDRIYIRGSLKNDTTHNVSGKKCECVRVCVSVCV